MRETKEVKTKSYWFDDAYMVDVIESEDYWNAFIYHHNFGIKEGVTGLPKVQPITKEVCTEQDYLDFLERDIPEHLDWYYEKYVIPSFVNEPPEEYKPGYKKTNKSKKEKKSQTELPKEGKVTEGEPIQSFITKALEPCEGCGADHHIRLVKEKSEEKIERYRIDTTLGLEDSDGNEYDPQDFTVEVCESETDYSFWIRYKKLHPKVCVGMVSKDRTSKELNLSYIMAHIADWVVQYIGACNCNAHEGDEDTEN